MLAIKDAERRKKKREEKKKQDEAGLNKAAETSDALFTSDLPATETVAWTPLSEELKELLESVPDLDDLPSYEEMMGPLLPTQGSVVVTPVEVKPEPQRTRRRNSYGATTSLRTWHSLGTPTGTIRRAQGTFVSVP